MNMQIIMVMVSYLFGSFPTGKILGLKIKHIDIQKRGSGNIGFANAVRVLGWKIGIAVLVVDILKGFIPLYFAKQYLDASQTSLMIFGLAAILGHAYPIWLKFKGGKSISTGLGVIFVLNIKLAILGILVYLTFFMIFKKSAIGSVGAAWSLIIFSIFIDKSLTTYCIILALLATYTHRENIKGLLK